MAEGDDDPTGHTAVVLAFALAAFPALIAIAVNTGFDPVLCVVVGLLFFGVAFAMNSAVHSYLILAYAEGDRVAMNVGFYYMANAGGRLMGTVLSGALDEWQGLAACLWVSTGLVLAAGMLTRLPLMSAAADLPLRRRRQLSSRDPSAPQTSCDSLRASRRLRAGGGARNPWHRMPSRKAGMFPGSDALPRARWRGPCRGLGRVCDRVSGQCSGVGRG